MNLYDIYKNLPIQFQNFLCSLYGLRQRFIFYGPGFNRHFKSFQKTQWYSISEIEALQTDLLVNIITHAYHHVPYYNRLFKQIGLEPEEIKSLDVLRRIPLLDKHSVRRHPEYFWSDNIPTWRTDSGRTSGTTGIPLEIRYNLRAIQKVWAAMERLREWGNVSRHDRRASFTGKVFVPTSKPAKGIYWRHEWIGNRLLFSVYHLKPSTYLAYVKKIKEFGPAFLDGYPAAIFELACFMLERRISAPSTIRAIFPTAETLTNEMRVIIEEAFDAKVHDQYGSTELACHAGECEYGRMHVSPEIGIVEIVDANGKPARKGEIGEIVITGLVNYAMPLIRYRIGDTAVPGVGMQQCECGREMPYIEELTGRLDDLVITPDGRRINILNYHMFKWADHILESQVIQEDFDHFHLRVVKGKDFHQEELDRAVNELRRRVGEDIQVEIEFLDRIPRTDRGKFRPVVSRIDGE